MYTLDRADDQSDYAYFVDDNVLALNKQMIRLLHHVQMTMCSQHIKHTLTKTHTFLHSGNTQTEK